MIIGIGSTNKAKIEACKNAFKGLKRQFLYNGQKIEFYPLETRTTVPDMPLHKDDLMKGALERALFVYDHFNRQENPVDFALGLEGGVYKDNQIFVDQAQTFLQSWVYAFNGEKGYFGGSPALPLPQTISSALYGEERELAEIIDDFSGQKDVRSNEGAFGILTRDLITRSTSFYLAVINSMVPFLNKQYYT